MSTSSHCPHCNTQLSVPGAPCPACLLSMGKRPTPVARPLSTPITGPPQEELAALFPALEILEVIGQGGMGVVYRARQRDLDRYVAIKILVGACTEDPAFGERFERESRVLASLDHTNIVRVHDGGLTGGYYWLMMEYVDGLNLRQVIKSGELSSRESLSVVGRVCDALQYAHNAGVVHRDIKPENILLDRVGNVKIADFGLARLVESEAGGVTLTRSDQALGTPQYMAPEQIKTPLAVDHRADIYSLGVVLYELLTGDLPLGHFPLPSDKEGVDIRLDEVVLRSLEREPERRYQQASEVKTDMERTVSNPPGRRGEKTRTGIIRFRVEAWLRDQLKKLRSARPVDFVIFTGTTVFIAVLTLFAIDQLEDRARQKSAERYRAISEERAVVRNAAEAEAGADAVELAWRKEVMANRSATRTLVEAGSRPRSVLLRLHETVLASPSSTTNVSSTGAWLEDWLTKLERRYREMESRAATLGTIYANGRRRGGMKKHFVPFHDTLIQLEEDFRSGIRELIPESELSDLELRVFSMELFPFGWAPIDVFVLESSEGCQWSETILGSSGEALWISEGSGSKLPEWLSHIGSVQGEASSVLYPPRD